MRSKPITRFDSHKRSWYSDNPSILKQQIEDWIAIAKNEENSMTKIQTNNDQGHCYAVIAPHAGFSYSGSTAYVTFCLKF